MQPRPTAEEILRDVAALLGDVLVPALSGPEQHQARVAASLIGIVHREVRLASGNDAAERDHVDRPARRRGGARRCRPRDPAS